LNPNDLDSVDFGGRHEEETVQLHVRSDDIREFGLGGMLSAFIYNQIMTFLRVVDTDLLLN